MCKRRFPGIWLRVCRPGWGLGSAVRGSGLGATCSVHWPWGDIGSPSALGSPQRAAGPLGWLFGGPSRLPPPQPQHSHLVIQQLLSHLDANSRSAATVRAGIVEVLSEAAVIAATGSVGKGVQSKRPGAGERGRGRTDWLSGL